MNNPKICPLMSKGENIVYCNENCAWRIDNKFKPKCAIPQIVEALNDNTKSLNTGLIVTIDKD